jgi:hypothetical protein
MNEKLTVLCLTNDTVLVRSLQDRTKSFAVEIQFVPCSSGEKLDEISKKYPLDAVLIDDAFIDPLKPALITKVANSLTSSAGKAPILFLISFDRDVASIRKILSFGFKDVFTKPVDPSLFFQKLQIYLPQVQFLRDNLLFNMDVNSTLDLALDCKLISASEYGATVVTNLALLPGDFFTIYGEMVGGHNGECLGRILTCIPKAGEKGRFEIKLIFIAPKKDLLSGIRLWIKHEYIMSKS